MSNRTDMFECKSYDFFSFDLKIWQFNIFNMTNDRTQVQLLAKLSDSEWIYIYMWCTFFQTIQCKFSNKYITNLMQVFKQICQINANFKAAWAEGGWSRTWNSRIKENRANSLGKWHGKDMMLTSIGTCKLLRSGWSEAVGSQPLGKVNFHGHLRHHLSHHHHSSHDHQHSDHLQDPEQTWYLEQEEQ